MDDDEEEDYDMSNLTRHPLLIFGLGLVMGIYAYKHRKEIAEAAAQCSEKAREAFMKSSGSSTEPLASNLE